MKLVRLPVPISFHIALVVCVTAGLASVVSAQASRAIPAVERRVETLNRQAREYDREDLGRGARKESDAESLRRARQIRIEVGEDLNGLQSLYNDLVLMLRSSSAGPAASYVTTSSAEIKKRAVRLKTNLALPEPEADPAKPSGKTMPEEPMRKSLGTLCKFILAFVTNPIFEPGALFDVNHATQAARDLDVIIEISGRLAEPSKPN